MLYNDCVNITESIQSMYDYLLFSYSSTMEIKLNEKIFITYLKITSTTLKLIYYTCKDINGNFKRSLTKATKILLFISLFPIKIFWKMN